MQTMQINPPPTYNGQYLPHDLGRTVHELTQNVQATMHDILSLEQAVAELKEFVSFCAEYHPVTWAAWLDHKAVKEKVTA